MCSLSCVTSGVFRLRQSSWKSSRLLDIAKSLETTPEENLRMAWRRLIECLQDNGLEVMVDLEHAMDAYCGRRENGTPWRFRSGKALPGLNFYQLAEQCLEQKVSRIVVCDTDRRRQPGGSC